MLQTKQKNQQPIAILTNKYYIVKWTMAFLGMGVLACSDKSSKVDLPYSNIDSISVTKREEGQSWEYAYAFTVKDKSFWNSMYSNYINNGKHIKNYYAKLPLHKYDFVTYRSSGKNDTFALYQDYMHLSNFGVIHLPRNLEPLFDRAFESDSLQKITVEN